MVDETVIDAFAVILKMNDASTSEQQLEKFKEAPENIQELILDYLVGYIDQLQDQADRTNKDYDSLYNYMVETDL
jgi:predicted solute-binding protein